MNLSNTSTLSRRAVLAAAGATTLSVVTPSWAQTMDHSHTAWTALLKKHVVLLGGGKGSQVRYAGMATDRAALKAYLDSLSAVSQSAFDAFSKPQQQAFLMNAYNAFTVELILSKYPNLQSIRDLGSLLKKPWSIKNVPLLGDTVTLDNIEHDMLRKRGRYDDPRVHFAVNCASIGCPMLREEAFVADKLEVQLEEQTRRFMSDRSRNRYDSKGGKLELSKIFDWYGDDFKLGHKGISSLPAFAAKYAELLADSAADRDKVRGQQLSISFLDYDWKLNDAR
jgi:hypothetical protein